MYAAFCPANPEKPTPFNTFKKCIYPALITDLTFFKTLFQFYKPLPKTNKNVHEASNLAHLTKFPKILFALLNLLLS